MFEGCLFCIHRFNIVLKLSDVKKRMFRWRNVYLFAITWYGSDCFQAIANLTMSFKNEDFAKGFFDSRECKVTDNEPNLVLFV